MQKIFDITIYKGKFFEVNQDWEIPIEGFLIIAPLRKICSFDDFTDDEGKEFIDILIKTRSILRKELGIENVYIFQNEDTAHNFHVWVFPRHKWMDEFGKGIESVKKIMEHSVNHTSKEDIEKVKEKANIIQAKKQY